MTCRSCTQTFEFESKLYLMLVLCSFIKKIGQQKTKAEVSSVLLESDRLTKSILSSDCGNNFHKIGN